MFLIAVDKFIPSSSSKQLTSINYWSGFIHRRFNCVSNSCSSCVPYLGKKKGESENPQCLMWLSNFRLLYSSVTVTQHITTVQRYCFLRRVRWTKCISWITVRKKFERMYADEWKPTFKIVFHSHVCQTDGLSDTTGYLGIFLQVQRYNFISIFTQRSRFRNTSKLIARLLN